MKVKLKKSNSILLQFVSDGKHYYYEDVQGYSFQTSLKCGNNIKLFTYKIGNKWFVNDDEGYYSNIVKGMSTRKAAVDSVCNLMKNYDRKKVENAFNKLKELRKNKIQQRKEINKDLIKSNNK